VKRIKVLYVVSALAASLFAAMLFPGAWSLAQTIGQAAQLNVGTLYVGSTAAATATQQAYPINFFQTGSFTGTLTGYASPPTGTIEYRITGDMVCLFSTAGISGTSNATSLTMTGAPAAVRPSVGTKLVNTLATDSGATVNASASIATSGTITFGMGAGFVSTGFTNTGTKGIPAGWTECWPLD
jgi:hypothetical protein